jgi:hypothetical protein
MGQKESYMKAGTDECLTLEAKKKNSRIDEWSPEMSYGMPARQYGVTYQKAINLFTKFLMKKISFTLNCKSVYSNYAFSNTIRNAVSYRSFLL